MKWPKQFLPNAEKAPDPCRSGLTFVPEIGAQRGAGALGVPVRPAEGRQRAQHAAVPPPRGRRAAPPELPLRVVHLSPGHQGVHQVNGLLVYENT